VKFDKGYYDGVIDYTINELAPNAKYYFKVRAGNGCATGSWSNWLAAKTDGGYTQTAISNSPNSSIIETTNDTTRKVIKPTKSVDSPTLGVSDSVAPPQPATQPTVKKSWWQKLSKFFGIEI